MFEYLPLSEKKKVSLPFPICLRLSSPGLASLVLPNKWSLLYLINLTPEAASVELPLQNRFLFLVSETLSQFISSLLGCSLEPLAHIAPACAPRISPSVLFILILCHLRSLSIILTSATTGAQRGMKSRLVRSSSLHTTHIRIALTYNLQRGFAVTLEICIHDCLLDSCSCPDCSLQFSISNRKPGTLYSQVPSLMLIVYLTCT